MSYRNDFCWLMITNILSTFASLPLHLERDCHLLQDARCHSSTRTTRALVITHRVITVTQAQLSSDTSVTLAWEHVAPTLDGTMATPTTKENALTGRSLRGSGAEMASFLLWNGWTRQWSVFVRHSYHVPWGNCCERKENRSGWISAGTLSSNYRYSYLLSFAKHTICHFCCWGFLCQYKTKDIWWLWFREGQVALGADSELL